MRNFCICFQKLGITSLSIFFYSITTTAQIVPDATLSNNSRVIQQDSIRIIEGGTQAGSNLFHSFQEFSVPPESTAHFNNANYIQNIISRVTGKSISNIDGVLKANGTANLFLINPNGIIFGSNASLNIGGSFVGSTASSLNFADGTKFSATSPTTTPLLTVSVPIGLQFGATVAPIRLASQASPNGATNILGDPVGIQVQTGKTLAIVGGDVVVDGGNLTAESGRIELGSVAGDSLVSLNPTNQGWSLGYEGVRDFQNIQISERIVDGSKIPSVVDTSGENGNGNIQLQGESVELIGNLVSLLNLITGARDAGDIKINARKLIVQDGAQALVNTYGSGAGGNLIVNASESVDLGGSYTYPNTTDTRASGLFSATIATGKAGDITVNTGRLRIQNGAQISVESSGEIQDSQFIPATGKGGNLTVNARESIELIGTSAQGFPTGLFATTLGGADGGKIAIATEKLIVQDAAAVSVSSQVPQKYIYLGDTRNLGKAGNLEVQARFIRMDNQGKLTSETEDGKGGGNITLIVRDLLLMRRNSQISTSAGKVQAAGDGGNVSINAPNDFIVAPERENSDITANAFTGSGGKVQINATAIFGTAPLSREDLVRLLSTNDPSKLDPQQLTTSDITAISQTSPTLSGKVNINTPNLNITQGLIELPTELGEPKLAQGCQTGVPQNQSQFIITGRGGLPPNPREFLRNNAVRVGWVSLEDVQNRKTEYAQKANSVNLTQVVEAQGWVVDANGDIVLVTQPPTLTPHSMRLNSVSCSF
ncbi:MAG: filamentous hemagglutinin N-terminal domain-containing protein [Cyanomargarita calcarea GSE-NOS-MK-12-04C]|jgi:filamentous hemagglutinin family protein|uniref:Filamentous hemagglutinin N-terminal domain-containing protein n=1 Tax=Cyanomargarita calcarea GSE-NOS-MK-12-04C TaxID=2839659 RepID=A0A951UU05_9CYAN|nr:filamentous hemagglutinin N-terminal domain-containing protein [Cyanomargarita calcarea GSE-NOS-MK-12-04C]